jgi:predicted permease
VLSRKQREKLLCWKPRLHEFCRRCLLCRLSSSMSYSFIQLPFLILISSYYFLCCPLYYLYFLLPPPQNSPPYFFGFLFFAPFPNCYFLPCPFIFSSPPSPVSIFLAFYLSSQFCCFYYYIFIRFRIWHDKTSLDDWFSTWGTGICLRRYAKTSYRVCKIEKKIIVFSDKHGKIMARFRVSHKRHGRKGIRFWSVSSLLSFSLF